MTLPLYLVILSLSAVDVTRALDTQVNTSMHLGGAPHSACTGAARARAAADEMTSIGLRGYIVLFDDEIVALNDGRALYRLSGEEMEEVRQRSALYGARAQALQAECSAGARK